MANAAVDVSELAALSETVRKIALHRFRLLQPHLEQNRPLRLVALEAGIAYRTAQRWVMRYQRYGLAALVRKNRNDRGQRRTLSPKMQEFIQGLALQKPPLPIAALCRQVQRFAREHGESAPTYDVVYDVVRQLPADLFDAGASWWKGLRRNL
jgi:putative transposase